MTKSLPYSRSSFNVQFQAKRQIASLATNGQAWPIVTEASLSHQGCEAQKPPRQIPFSQRLAIHPTLIRPHIPSNRLRSSWKGDRHLSQECDRMCCI